MAFTGDEQKKFYEKVQRLDVTNGQKRGEIFF